MKTSFSIIIVTALLAFSPANARVDTPFPSQAIQPMVSYVDGEGPSTKEDYALPPMPEAEAKEPETVPPQQISCASATDGAQGQDEGDRVSCAQIVEYPVGQSEVPQLRPFRQNSSQRYAP